MNSMIEIKAREFCYVERMLYISMMEVVPGSCLLHTSHLSSFPARPSLPRQGIEGQRCLRRKVANFVGGTEALQRSQPAVPAVHTV